jgi:hypothetical protein
LEYERVLKISYFHILNITKFGGIGDIAQLVEHRPCSNWVDALTVWMINISWMITSSTRSQDWEKKTLVSPPFPSYNTLDTNINPKMKSKPWLSSLMTEMFIDNFCLTLYNG